jgi:hypothetical protein
MCYSKIHLDYIIMRRILIIYVKALHEKATQVKAQQVNAAIRLNTNTAVCHPSTAIFNRLLSFGESL